MNKKRADLQESNEEANGISMQLVDNYVYFPHPYSKWLLLSRLLPFCVPVATLNTGSFRYKENALFCENLFPKLCPSVAYQGSKIRCTQKMEKRRMFTFFCFSLFLIQSRKKCSCTAETKSVFALFATKNDMDFITAL